MARCLFVNGNIFPFVAIADIAWNYSTAITTRTSMQPVPYVYLFFMMQRYAFILAPASKMPKNQCFSGVFFTPFLQKKYPLNHISFIPNPP